MLNSNTVIFNINNFQIHWSYEETTCLPAAGIDIDQVIIKHNIKGVLQD